MIQSIHAPVFAREDWSRFDLDGETCLLRMTVMSSEDWSLVIDVFANRRFRRSRICWDGHPTPRWSGESIATSLVVHRRRLIV